ncbi:Hypothetical protein D9617_1g079670 [Elsinoe fawcettii]|nr:Hypothetical protein D9617_1g079670 [Elsinoe fawcettii]
MKSTSSLALLVVVATTGTLATPLPPLSHDGDERRSDYQLSRREPKLAVDLSRRPDIRPSPGPTTTIEKRLVNPNIMKIDPTTKPYQDAVKNFYGDKFDITKRSISGQDLPQAIPPSGFDVEAIMNTIYGPGMTPKVRRQETLPPALNSDTVVPANPSDTSAIEALNILYGPLKGQKVRRQVLPPDSNPAPKPAEPSQPPAEGQEDSPDMTTKEAWEIIKRPLEIMQQIKNPKPAEEALPPKDPQEAEPVPDGEEKS